MSGKKKRLILLGIGAGVTAAVYFVFKYILPLVAPFVVALLIALAIEKIVKFMAERLRIHRVIGAVLVLAVVGVILTAAVYYVGGKIISEVRTFVQNYDIISEEVDNTISNMCANVEKGTGISQDVVEKMVERSRNAVFSGIKSNVVQVIMGKGIPAIKAVSVWLAVVFITLISVIFISKDMDKLKRFKERSRYSYEMSIVLDKLAVLLLVYLKTQLVIMTITTAICSVALYFLKNPYAVLIGILIGLLDALPIFGTGTVLIPWTLVYLVMGEPKKALLIFAAYIICYVAREVLEPKMMGGELALSPLVLLITMYVGLLIFGITGFILGPAAFIIIKEIMEEIEKIC